MKRKYSGLLLGMVVMLTACGQEPAQNTGEIGQNGEPTLIFTLTPISAPTSTPTPEVSEAPQDVTDSAATGTPEPSPVVYTEYEVADGIRLLLSPDEAEKCVVVMDGAETELQLEGKYDLTYGEPIISYDGRDSGFDGIRLFCFALPQQECEPVSPVGAEEICGAWYEVWYSKSQKTMKVVQATDRTIPDKLSDMSAVRTEDGHLRLEFQVGYYHEVYDFPAVMLPEGKDYEPVKEKALHITDTLLSYRRVGLDMDGEILWLGSLWDAVSCAKREEHYFIPDKHVQYGGNAAAVHDAWLASGELTSAEPDFRMDLDGDGTPETVSFRKKTDMAGLTSVSLQINGEEISFENAETDAVFWRIDSVLYLMSMDGKTVQLALKTWENTDLKYVFYSYHNGKPDYVGWMPDYELTVTGRNADGGVVLTAKFDELLLQLCGVPRTYSYVSGKLEEIKPDFYEFISLNELTAKEEFELYVQPGEENTFPVAEGSTVRLVGSSDLKEWVLLENVQTGDQGWMRMQSETECLLPDGRSLNSEDLFEGIWFGG